MNIAKPFKEHFPTILIHLGMGAFVGLLLGASFGITYILFVALAGIRYIQLLDRESAKRVGESFVVRRVGESESNMPSIGVDEYFALRIKAKFNPILNLRIVSDLVLEIGTIMGTLTAVMLPLIAAMAMYQLWQTNEIQVLHWASSSNRSSLNLTTIVALWKLAIFLTSIYIRAVRSDFRSEMWLSNRQPKLELKEFQRQLQLHFGVCKKTKLEVLTQERELAFSRFTLKALNERAFGGPAPHPSA